MAKPTSDEIKNNIQTEDANVWKKADKRPEALDVFETDLANAIAKAWSDIESAFAIASVPVIGGSSAPSGPLIGGTATLSPGMLTNTASFIAIASKFSSSFTYEAKEGLLALVDAIAQGIGQKFTLWLTGYSATLVAIGGSCAWVTSTPATPAGTPGPWKDGSIQGFPIANGNSTGDQGMTAPRLEIAIGNMADPSKLKQNQNTLQPALNALIKAIAKGFETTWNQWKSCTKISGGTGTGIARPPDGAVEGNVTNPIVR